jgi:hypothetical protein
MSVCLFHYTYNWISDMLYLSAQQNRPLNHENLINLPPTDIFDNAAQYAWTLFAYSSLQLKSTPLLPRATHTTRVIIHKFHHLTSLTHCTNSNKSLLQNRKQIFMWVDQTVPNKPTSSSSALTTTKTKTPSPPKSTSVCLSALANSHVTTRQSPVLWIV